MNRRRSRGHQIAGLCVYVTSMSLVLPAHARAQLSDPCTEACGAALVGTGMVAATGTVVAAGLLSGGLSTTTQGIVTWGTSFAAVVGAGSALQGDGHRQERAVYCAAVGSAVGAALGLALAATASDRRRMLASTLVGAAAGVFIGGVYGAATASGGDALTPSMSVSFSF